MKFKVPRLAPVAKRLAALRAKKLGTVIQEDCYFDTPNRRLLRRGCGVRLRMVRPARGGGARGWAELTYKGPSRRGAKAKIRPEHQTRVEDASALAAVLAGCGLRPMLHLQKRRAIYSLGRCTVALDDLPVLGCFIEIEGPGQAAIASVGRRLHLPGPAIRRHYVSLLQACCSRAGRACLGVTFRTCRGCARRAP